MLRWSSTMVSVWLHCFVGSSVLKMEWKLKYSSCNLIQFAPHPNPCAVLPTQVMATCQLRCLVVIPHHGLENQLKCVLLVLLPGYDAAWRALVPRPAMVFGRAGCARTRQETNAHATSLVSKPSELWHESQSITRI
ncbi:hypothetical protein PHLGIDRAFT_484849 [Phlebiopsis gigantea 11061_1 CR5-6]|uniref:Secreted protein n=1 Tax=Phlebiopsis gigantea (strain 11061_1 CR5-6) TaxID=745531 RepID=A0A0C3S5W0_PHLG1|nr:hypothetical protein PHLGIDRAFT_484849 [Phlebiopsis gigantea 11061_1 CR5-6]